MPPVAAILTAATIIATRWWRLSIGWHLALAALLFALWRGWCPSRRTAGLLLVLPLISVSALAWWSGNPVNSTVFAALAIGLGWHSSTLGRDVVSLSPRGVLIPATLLVKFGWLYPHFLGPVSWTYLIAAPLGLLPCPTLAAVIGLLLMLDMLDSRAWGVTAGLAALVYGVIGVFRLGVLLDVGLLLGAVFVLALAATRRRHPGAVPRAMIGRVAA